MVSFPAEVFVLPLANQVTFPSVKPSILVTHEVFAQIVGYCEKSRTRVIALVCQEPGNAVNSLDASSLEPYEVGCLGELTGQKQVEKGVQLMFEGKSRFQVLEYTQKSPFRLARISLLQDRPFPESEETKSLVASVKEALQEIVIASNPKQFGQAGGGGGAPALQINWPSNAGLLADMVGSGMGQLTVPERQQVLEELDVLKRLEMVRDFLTRMTEGLRLTNEINGQMQKRMEGEMKEMMLRRQLGELQQELRKVRTAAVEPDPEWDDMAEEDEDEVAKVKAMLMAANMPPEARKVAQVELKRLQQMQPQNPEFMVSRTYLDLLANLPWGKSSADTDDLVRARAILDGDHYGLEKVKKRVLEFLAVQKLRRNMKGPILCLHGPPGVGKTSLGRSIARSLGRKFYRVALGGVRDESELRGHRKTYIGAMPGVIVEALRQTDTNNPVILLDEIEKMTNNSQGNPAAALLEILDPEQNHAFKDHYLNTPFDLSNVLFLATCNDSSLIDRALYDRMEVIDLGGYTVEEKVHIATSHLLPKQRRTHALEKEDPEAHDTPDEEVTKTEVEKTTAPTGPEEPLLTITTEAIQDLVRKWTVESGVRSLERLLARVCRFAALRIAESISGESVSPKEDSLVPMEGQTQTEKDAITALASCGPIHGKVVVEARHLPYIVGMAMLEPEIAERLTVGAAMGLAVSGAGGSLMFIETIKIPGHGALIITGSLGEVMRESVSIALSLLRSKVQNSIEKNGGFHGSPSSGTMGTPGSLPFGDTGGPAPAAVSGVHRRPEVLSLKAAGAGEPGQARGDHKKVMQALTLRQQKQNAPELFGGADLHVHFPAGGIPKDGPSAGVAITLALASLFLGRPVRSDTAVTGEITLRGHILPVGGIKDKVLAAHRAGLKHVLLPEDNRKHVKEEVTGSIFEDLEVHYVKHIDEAIAWAFAEELEALPFFAGESNAGGIARASSFPLRSGL